MTLRIVSHLDFIVQPLENKSGTFLELSIPDTNLVVFFSPACSASRKLIPHIEDVSVSRIQRGAPCGICLCNVSDHRDIIEMSKGTIQPIKYVPFLVIYHQGRPVISYKGPLTADAIGFFIDDVIENLASLLTPSTGTTPDSTEIARANKPIEMETAVPPVKLNSRGYALFNTAYNAPETSSISTYSDYGSR